MKTSEFKRELKKYDAVFIDGLVYNKDYGDADDWVANINTSHRGYVDWFWEDSSNGFNLDLFNLINEYAATSIDERKDEKRYNVKIPHISGEIYQKIDDGKLLMQGIAYGQNENTQFTLEEIEQYGLQDCEKVEVGEDEDN